MTDAGHRPVDVRRDRRRPDHRDDVPRRAPALRGGPRDRRDRPDRRDRRLGRGGGGRLGRRAPARRRRWPRSSPAGRRPRASGWATPARSSRADPERRHPRSPRSRRPASGWPARPPSCRRCSAPRVRASGPADERHEPRRTSGSCSPTTAGRTRRVLNAAAATSTRTIWSRPDAIGERGLGGILVHALGAHARWRTGWQGRDDRPRPSCEPLLSPDELRDRWEVEWAALDGVSRRPARTSDLAAPWDGYRCGRRWSTS